MPLRWILALIGIAVAQPALAQQQEPPARVGAVTYVSGNIAFHTEGETQWSAAGVNYPVATGGSFWTDPQSRAELQIGPSTIDMSGGTEIDVTNLNEEVAQIGVPQGRLYLHLRQLNAGQSFEIDLPQGAVWLLQPGAYDIDSGSVNQPARIAVFDGSARFVGGGADIGVQAGDVALLNGSNPVTAQFEHATPDAFVEWCRSRDYQPSQVAAATRYVSPQMTGYADLDQYGNWQPSPQYGEVWYPSEVPADWAPYRDGRWVWVEPWGWTWVGQQPWGFAPFHYGRWAHINDRWGWVPGQDVPQPVYAPALVAFVGAAAGGVAIAGEAGPAVGWFPLAPDEPYWPSYTHNETYIRNVNRANVRDINTVVTRSHGAPPPRAANANFANRRFATVVPQRVFANADPVAPHAMHVAPAALAKAPVVLHPPALKPAAKPAAVAARGPATTRPVPRGPGTPPPGHPRTVATTPSGTEHPPEHRPAPGHPGTVATTPPGTEHPPGTPPEHRPAPGHPGAPANTAGIPPHPGAATGAANANERGPHPAAGALAAHEPGRAPGPPEPGGAHRPETPHTAALPASRGAERPPAHEARPAAAPGHAPAAASVLREAPRPALTPEHRAAPAIGARPAAPPHPQPSVHAQAVRPPPPVARPAAVRPPPVAHPPPPMARPAAVRPPPVARPAAPPRPPPAPHPAAAPHPIAMPHPAPAPRPAPAPHPPAAHPAPAAHGGGHPGEKRE